MLPKIFNYKYTRNFSIMNLIDIIPVSNLVYKLYKIDKSIQSNLKSIIKLNFRIA